MWWSFLGVLLIFLIVESGLIAIGIGFGFLLHRTIAAVDVGTGILIGVVATGFSILFFVRLMTFLNAARDVGEPVEAPPQAPRSWLPPAPRRGDRRNRRSS
jgi:hypothetical protein